MKLRRQSIAAEQTLFDELKMLVNKIEPGQHKQVMQNYVQI